MVDVTTEKVGVIVLLGPPGAGKGTQSRRIASQYGIPHISSGEILRDSVRDRTASGLHAKELMERGELVSDDVICAIMSERLHKDDCKRGFVLDGFPRTVAQAVWLDGFIKNHFTDSKLADSLMVIRIQVDNSQLFFRLSGRRSCSTCGATYNVYFKPPRRIKVCDVDGTELTLREDDKLDVVRARLDVHEQQLRPLISYYEKNLRVLSVDGKRTSEDVSNELLTEIGNYFDAKVVGI